MRHKIWLDCPANAWDEGLPLGNGALASWSQEACKRMCSRLTKRPSGMAGLASAQIPMPPNG